VLIGCDIQFGVLLVRKIPYAFQSCLWIGRRLNLQHKWLPCSAGFSARWPQYAGDAGDPLHLKPSAKGQMNLLFQTLQGHFTFCPQFTVFK